MKHAKHTHTHTHTHIKKTARPHSTMQHKTQSTLENHTGCIHLLVVASPHSPLHWHCLVVADSMVDFSSLLVNQHGYSLSLSEEKQTQFSLNRTSQHK